MTMRRCPLALLVLALLLGNSLGRAQPGPAPLPRCREDPECARLLDAGKERSKAEQFEEARRFYEQAYERGADPQLVFNIARMLHRAGRPADAIPFYQKFIDAGADGDEAQRRRAEQYLEQARRESAPPPTPLPPTQAPPVILTAVQPGPPIARPDAHRETPVYRKWWLWTTVGVAVASIAIGVGLGVAAYRPDVSDAVAVRPFAN